MMRGFDSAVPMIWAHPAQAPDRAIRLNKFLPGRVLPGKNLYRSYPLRGRFSGPGKPVNVTSFFR
jgi:hypothetical protein